VRDQRAFERHARQLAKARLLREERLDLAADLDEDGRTHRQRAELHDELAVLHLVLLRVELLRGLHRDVPRVLHNLLHHKAAEVIERVELLAHEAFLAKVRRAHRPAVLLRNVLVIFVDLKLH
jgi:hypothetical protein